LAAFLAAGAAALPASAATTQRFSADLHDNVSCPGVDLCGKGLVHGFGTATTTLTFTSFGPGPGNCAAVTAERSITLDRDGSTLQLAIVGVLCPKGNPNGEAAGSGTFTVAGGTGIFAGATGSGLLSAQATGVPGPSDTAHYDGTITLP
jgi:hypothetical protein